MRLKNTNIVCQNGFTILEVMISLAIIGISIGIFFGLIGNSSRLRGKIDDHSNYLLLARTKTDEALLGILGKEQEKMNEEKNFEGTTKDGVQWKAKEINKRKEAMDKLNSMNLTDEDKSMAELPPKGSTFLSIVVEGINIDTIYFTKEPEEDETKAADKSSD